MDIFLRVSAENDAVTTQVALVAKSPVERMIANFFLGLNKPQVPVRMFTDPDKARAWLGA